MACDGYYHSHLRYISMLYNAGPCITQVCSWGRVSNPADSMHVAGGGVESTSMNMCSYLCNIDAVPLAQAVLGLVSNMGWLEPWGILTAEGALAALCRPFNELFLGVV
jgi:hypothetical protein